MIEITQFSLPQVQEIILLFMMCYILITVLRLTIRILDRFFEPLIERIYNRFFPLLSDTNIEENIT